VVFEIGAKKTAVFATKNCDTENDRKSARRPRNDHRAMAAPSERASDRNGAGEYALGCPLERHAGSYPRFSTTRRPWSAQNGVALLSLLHLKHEKRRAHRWHQRTRRRRTDTHGAITTFSSTHNTHNLCANSTWRPGYRQHARLCRSKTWRVSASARPQKISTKGIRLFSRTFWRLPKTEYRYSETTLSRQKFERRDVLARSDGTSTRTVQGVRVQVLSSRHRA